MGSDEWWKPSKLQKTEEETRSISSLEDLDTENDFGSYKLMLETDDPASAQIGSHNDIAPRYRVSMIKKILGDFNPKKIVDVGCGLGFTTHQLSKQFPGTEVVGVDVSKDAIEYATKSFSDCYFVSDIIDPDNLAQVLRADLICCFEFYPFTRTKSIDEHERYIRHLLNGLNGNGKLVIFQLWDNDDSLSNNYEILQNSLSDLEFRLYSMPIRKVGYFISNRVIANALSEVIRPILRLITKRKIGRNKLIVIQKK